MLLKQLIPIEILNYNLSTYKIILISLAINVSISFCDTFRHITNITSLLNTTNIQNFNEAILVATSGGIYTYNPTANYFKSYVNELDDIDVKVIALNNDRIWLGGDIIQILNNDFELLTTIDYLDVNNIKKIVFSDNNIFILAEYDSQAVVLEFTDDDIPIYKNLYNFDSFDINRINDILVIDDFVYVGTDKGLLYANFINTNLLLNSSWIKDFENRDIIFLINDDSQIQFFSKYDDEYCLFDVCDSNIDDMPIGIIEYLNDYLLITEKNIYKILTEFENIYSLSTDINSRFQDIEIKNNKIYCALEENGILNITDDDLIIPNTIFQSNFKSIDIKDNKTLIGISNEGGFIIDDVYSDLQNYNAKNFHPLYYYTDNEEYRQSTFPDNDNLTNSINYYGKTLSYLGGENVDANIIFNQENNFKFNISKLRLNQEDFEYDGYNWFINNGGENISLLFDIDQDNIEINESFGDSVFTGLQGFYNLNDDENNTVLRHILYDENNNLWVVNPYSEKKENNGEFTNRPLAIKMESKDEWIYIEDNNSSFLPNEIAFDEYNNAWIAYQYESSYSPGGIKFLQINSLLSDDYEFYNDSSNPMIDNIIVENLGCNLGEEFKLQLSNINVWSLDIGKDKSNNTILWILSDIGVMGYIVNYNYSEYLNIFSLSFEPFECDFFFTDLSFNSDSKIRVDNQNNAWISTHDGVRVIQSNGEIWPEDFTINTENTKLLSNQINDIIFDDNGYVYISNNKGISIFETSFAVSKKKYNNFSISPNPYIPRKHDYIKLTNLPTYSTIQIITLEGRVLKEFKTQNETSILNWDGKDKNGSYLNTGVYLIAVYNNKFGSLVNKIAIINN